MVFLDVDVWSGGGPASRSHSLLRYRMDRGLRAGPSAGHETNFGDMQCYCLRRKFMGFPACFRGPISFRGFGVFTIDSRGRMDGFGAWEASIRGAVRRIDRA